MREVRGNTAFVTGGASGMGLAMARAFTKAGMKVVKADIKQAALDAAQAELKAANVEFLNLQLDVKDRAAVEDATAQAEARFGKVHVLCNNAGVAVGGPIDHMAYTDCVVGVNLPASRPVARAAISSTPHRWLATSPFRGSPCTTATKFAVVGISETMRAVWRAEHRRFRPLPRHREHQHLHLGPQSPLRAGRHHLRLAGRIRRHSNGAGRPPRGAAAGERPGAVVGDRCCTPSARTSSTSPRIPSSSRWRTCARTAGGYARWQSYREERGGVGGLGASQECAPLRNGAATVAPERFATTVDTELVRGRLRV